MAELPVCPNCSKQTTRHCQVCAWLVCSACQVVYGKSNVIRYGKAAKAEAEAERRKNGK